MLGRALREGPSPPPASEAWTPRRRPAPGPAPGAASPFWKGLLTPEMPLEAGRAGETGCGGLICRPEPPASSPLTRQALPPLGGLQEGPCESPTHAHTPARAGQLPLLQPSVTPRASQEPCRPRGPRLAELTGYVSVCACVCARLCLCVHMCACVYVCAQCLSRVSMCACSVCACVFLCALCMHMCLCMCMCVRTYTPMCACVCKCACVSWVSTYVRACVPVCIHVCACVCARVPVCTLGEHAFACVCTSVCAHMCVPVCQRAVPGLGSGVPLSRLQRDESHGPGWPTCPSPLSCPCRNRDLLAPRPSSCPSRFRKQSK